MPEPICCGETRTTLLWKFADKEGIQILPPCVEIEINKLGSWWEKVKMQFEGIDNLYSSEYSINDSDKNAVYTVGEAILFCTPEKRTGWKIYRNGVHLKDSGGTCNNTLQAISFYFRDGDGCEIVAKLNGKKIWAVTGACPASYKSACGDNCPPQTMKCKTTAYPGFSCMPCSQFRR